MGSQLTDCAESSKALIVSVCKLGDVSFKSSFLIVFFLGALFLVLPAVVLYLYVGTSHPPALRISTISCSLTRF